MMPSSSSATKNDDGDGRAAAEHVVSQSDGDANDASQQSSSSWSIFGKRTSTNDCCSEEKMEPTTAVEEGKSGEQESAGVIESGIFILPQADTTSSPSLPDETRSSSSWSIFGKRPSANDDGDGRAEHVVSQSDGYANDASQQSSSSWSIFGMRTSTKDCCSEEKREPTTAVEEGKPEQEAAGVIESGIIILPQADTTSSPSLPDETRSSSSWPFIGKRPPANDDGDGRAEHVASQSDGNVNDASLSSSWSIFGKRTSTDNCLEEKREPATTVEERPKQDAGVIESSIKIVQKTSETTKNIPTASAIGMVAGGVAGWAIAGPAGVLVGSQIGRNILAVGAVVEGGIGVSVLVMNLANAANLSLRSASERGRELKLNSTLVLVRPDIAVEPVWGEYAEKARKLWELKHGASAQSQSSGSGFGLGSLFCNTDTSKDERNVRYQKDSDIVKADASELPTRDKVFLLVNRILNDKLSLPGYQYRYLILKHKRRTMFGDEGSTVDVSGEPSIRSCRQDAHGIIKHVTATLLEVRPGLATSPAMTELTACAVEILIFGDLYDDCFGEVVQLTEEKDESLLAKVKALMRKCDDGRTTSVDESDTGVSSSVSQSAISALQSVPRAHTPTDKLLHCVEFLECVSAHFSSTFRGKCIDADTLLLMVCQHVVAANIQHLHAEVAFIEEFSRDEQLLSGKEGYALITLQASLHYLDSLDDLPCDVSPSLAIGGKNGSL